MSIVALTLGKKFEQNFQESCKKQKIFFHRIKDVCVPPELRAKINIPQNKYDNLVFHWEHLFPLELKSSGQRSVSFSEKIIKQHQIDNLLEASEYENVVPGFVFNFRNYDNRTFFVHITDFIEYKDTIEKKRVSTYKSKINKNSISLDICGEIGIEIKNQLKRTNYSYDILSFLKMAISRWD